jgi:integrase
VAAALRSYLADLPPRQPVWPGEWYLDAAAMLRQDLALAGIPYRDDMGRVVDFHALRHSYITLLSRSGVAPRVAQELARHSTLDLTM